MESFRERIKQVVFEVFDGNQAKFAKHCGIPATTVASILGPKNGCPKYDTVLLMASALSNKGVDKIWLLTGEKTSMELPALSDSESELSFLREILALKDDIIRLQRENKELGVALAEAKAGFIGKGNGSAPNASAKTA